MAFVVDLFLSLTARPSFLALFSAYLIGFVTLPFRGVGVSFEEPHLRVIMLKLVELGFP